MSAKDKITSFTFGFIIGFTLVYGGWHLVQWVF